MKLAAVSSCLPQNNLGEVLGYCHHHGIDALELGVGGYPGTRHANAHILKREAVARETLKQQCHARGVALAALACHGNPLHPDESRARSFHEDFMAALEAANALEVPVLVGFSGQPGHGDVPNWPVLAWPDEYRLLHEQQWNERLIPYWLAVCARARELGVRIALEMHGGFAVHSPATLLRLRAACGDILGVNVDPSHLWWQAIDPVQAIHRLGAGIFHVHLKDVRFNAERLAENGVLDCTPFSRPHERAWHFAAPGEGHDADTWRAVLAALAEQGYSGVLSIEHEGLAPAIEAIGQTAHWMRQLDPAS